MAPRTGVRLIFSRSARSASRIHVPGERRPCTISSRISRNAVMRLVPCSGFARELLEDIGFFLVTMAGTQLSHERNAKLYTRIKEIHVLIQHYPVSTYLHNEAHDDTATDALPSCGLPRRRLRNQYTGIPLTTINNPGQVVAALKQKSTTRTTAAPAT